MMLPVFTCVDLCVCVLQPWRNAHGVQTNCRARVSLIPFLSVSKEEEEGEEGGQDGQEEAANLIN